MNIKLQLYQELICNCLLNDYLMIELITMIEVLETFDILVILSIRVGQA